MRADRAGQLEETEQPRLTAVNLRDFSHQHDRLADDEKHVEERARADRRDDGDAFGGAGDFAPRFFVQRRDEITLGKGDQIASVDNPLQIVVEQRARPAGVRTIFIELAKFADALARSLTVIARMRLGQRGMQLGDTILPADGAKLARDGDEGGDGGETAQGLRPTMPRMAECWNRSSTNPHIQSVKRQGQKPADRR